MPLSTAQDILISPLEHVRLGLVSSLNSPKDILGKRELRSTQFDLPFMTFNDQGKPREEARSSEHRPGQKVVAYPTGNYGLFSYLCQT